MPFLSERLREETKRNHQELEGVLIPRIKAIGSASEYEHLLRLFYGYFGALERKFSGVIDTSGLPDHADRRKAHSLAADIVQLGGEVPELAEDSMIPEIKGHLQALGALYVIEGSTLGGKIISGMISGRLGEEIEPALSFFRGYGDRMGEMWDSFKRYLDEQVVLTSEQDQVIAAANESFLRFRTLALEAQ